MGWGHVMGNVAPRDDPSWWVKAPQAVDLSRFWDNVAWWMVLDRCSWETQMIDTMVGWGSG